MKFFHRLIRIRVVAIQIFLFVTILFFVSSAYAVDLSYYPSRLSVGDVVLSSNNPNNLLLLTDVIASFNGDTFSTTSSSSLIAYDNSIFQHSGTFISNWANPNGSPLLDVFVHSRYDLINFDTSNGISTWMHITYVYSIELTTLPVTKVALSDTEFTALYSSLTGVTTDSTVIRQIFSDVQTLNSSLNTALIVLARIEANQGETGMNYETAVLAGLLLALIFAVTWKG